MNHQQDIIRIFKLREGNISDAVFEHANGKNTIQEVCTPYRLVGERTPTHNITIKITKRK